MNIAGHEIGKEPFTIGEVGLNHQGSIERALEMIRVAAKCGVDCVKFQTFRAEGVCDADQMYTYKQGDCEITERRISIFKRCELPERAWPILKAECEKRGVIFMSTPQNPSDLDILLKVGIPAIKVGSDDLTNFPMLRYCSRDDIALPIILSCGMSNMNEVMGALGIVGGLTGRPTAVLVCTSQYPCPPTEANLSRITTLRKLGIPIGFSDHTQNSHAAMVASALGACIFEKHFTLNNNELGPDHAFSAAPHELMMWVKAIKEAKTLLGSGEVLPSARELENKRKYQRRSA